jgi:hypothetical protein
VNREIDWLLLLTLTHANALCLLLGGELRRGPLCCLHSSLLALTKEGSVILHIWSSFPTVLSNPVSLFWLNGTRKAGLSLEKTG